MDAMMGVSWRNVLEKAIDKVLIAGVPSYGIPLHSGDCKNTTLDESWVWDVLEKHEEPPATPTTSYVPLMRSANELFDVHFGRLLPRVLSKGLPHDRVHAGWRGLVRFAGGRIDVARPGGARGPRAADAAVPAFPDSVSRLAMAIEAFHKASLVHDDIEDDDLYRYGRETLHRQHD